MSDRMTSIAEAMEHFGLKSKGESQKSKVFILAEEVRRTRKTIIVRPKNADSGKVWPEQVEFMIEQVTASRYRDDQVLVKIPAAYVETFGLRACVLPRLMVEAVEAMVEKYHKEL